MVRFLGGGFVFLGLGLMIWFGLSQPEDGLTFDFVRQSLFGLIAGVGLANLGGSLLIVGTLGCPGSRKRPEGDSDV